MDQAGASERDAGDKTAAHQVGQDRAETGLDDVAAESPEDGFAGVFRCVDGGEKRAEILRGEKVGKRIKPSCERGAGRPTGEVGDGDLAFARTERIGGEFAETERVGRVDRGHSGCFTVARRVNLGKKRAQRPKKKARSELGPSLFTESFSRESGRSG